MYLELFYGVSECYLCLRFWAIFFNWTHIIKCWDLYLLYVRKYLNCRLRRRGIVMKMHSTFHFVFLISHLYIQIIQRILFKLNLIGRFTNVLSIDCNIASNAVLLLFGTKSESKYYIQSFKVTCRTFLIPVTFLRKLQMIVIEKSGEL